MEVLPQHLHYTWLLESPYIQEQEENPYVPHKYIPILENICHTIITPSNIMTIVDMIEFFQLSRTTQHYLLKDATYGNYPCDHRLPKWMYKYKNSIIHKDHINMNFVKHYIPNHYKSMIKKAYKVGNNDIVKLIITTIQNMYIDIEPFIGYITFPFNYSSITGRVMIRALEQDNVVLFNATTSTKSINLGDFKYIAIHDAIKCCMSRWKEILELDIKQMLLYCVWNNAPRVFNYIYARVKNPMQYITSSIFLYDIPTDILKIIINDLTPTQLSHCLTKALDKSNYESVKLLYPNRISQYRISDRISSYRFPYMSKEIIRYLLNNGYQFPENFVNTLISNGYMDIVHEYNFPIYYTSTTLLFAIKGYNVDFITDLINHNVPVTDACFCEAIETYYPKMAIKILTILIPHVEKKDMYLEHALYHGGTTEACILLHKHGFRCDPNALNADALREPDLTHYFYKHERFDKDEFIKDCEERYTQCTCDEIDIELCKFIKKKKLNK